MFAGRALISSIINRIPPHDFSCNIPDFFSRPALYATQQQHLPAAFITRPQQRIFWFGSYLRSAFITVLDGGFFLQALDFRTTLQDDILQPPGHSTRQVLFSLMFIRFCFRWCATIMRMLHVLFISSKSDTARPRQMAWEMALLFRMLQLSESCQSVQCKLVTCHLLWRYLRYTQLLAGWPSFTRPDLWHFHLDLYYAGAVGAPNGMIHREPWISLTYGRLRPRWMPFFRRTHWPMMFEPSVRKKLDPWSHSVFAMVAGAYLETVLDRCHEFTRPMLQDQFWSSVPIALPFQARICHVQNQPWVRSATGTQVPIPSDSSSVRTTTYVIGVSTD